MRRTPFDTTAFTSGTSGLEARLKGSFQQPWWPVRIWITCSAWGKAKDLLAHTLPNQPVDLRSTFEDPLYAPERMPALQVLERFKPSDTHTLPAVDE